MNIARQFIGGKGKQSTINKVLKARMKEQSFVIA